MESLISLMRAWSFITTWDWISWSIASRHGWIVDN